MSAGSGTTVSQKLVDAFVAAQNSDVALIKVEISNGQFHDTFSSPSRGSERENFQAAQSFLQDRKPCYILMKSDEQWRIIFFVPDDSPVRDRMIFASSTSALKLGLGNKFLRDFVVRDKDECSLEHFVAQHSNDVDESEVMTLAEMESKEAVKESMLAVTAVTTKIAGMSDIPMKIADSATEAVQNVQSGAVTTVVLKLDPTSEQLEAVAVGNMVLADVVADLPNKEPRYLLQNHHHEHDGKQAQATILVYYCPDASLPRLKMFYSTCKSNVVRMCETLNLPIKKQIEVSDSSELTDKLVVSELYPPPVENQTFSKPTARGRAGASKPKFVPRS